MMRSLAVVLLVVVLPGLALGQEVHIALRPQVELASSIATLADIAQISGDDQLAARLGGVTILEISQLGAHRIDATMVRNALAPIRLLRLDAISGTCQLSRRALIISAKDMVAAAITQVTGGDANVQATPVRDEGAVVVPDDRMPSTMAIDALDNAPSGEIPYRVRIMRGQQELARTLVVLKVVRSRDLVVAARDIKRGDVLAATDVRIEHMLVQREYEQVPSDAQGLMGNIAKTDLPTGTPLAPGLFKAPCDVHGGQRVTLLYVSTNFQITGAGEAMADGKIGDVIMVRRVGDGQLAKGKVSAADTVQMNF